VVSARVVLISRVNEGPIEVNIANMDVKEADLEDEYSPASPIRAEAAAIRGIKRRRRAHESSELVWAECMCPNPTWHLYRHRLTTTIFFLEMGASPQPLHQSDAHDCILLTKFKVSK
jgi:hypothetical protein